MKRLTEKTNDDIKQNITESEKQNATGAGSVTEGDKRLVDTETGKHPQNVDLMAAIQFNNKRMSYEGADLAIQAHYDEVMEWLYADNECGERHPYFNGARPDFCNWEGR